MSGFTCPFCNQIMSESNDTLAVRRPSFNYFDEDMAMDINHNVYSKDTLEISFYRCPSCTKSTILVSGIGYEIELSNVPLWPNSTAKQFPEYIPEQIRNDYHEACAIVNLSPKASATLSRRCLQGMIHDFWEIKLKNLNHEITALKEKIDPNLWNAIDSLRELGNIGAHMEADVNVIIDIDSNEAETLINLIELLIKEWYINRHDRELLFNNIHTTNATKQIERKSGV